LTEVLFVGYNHLGERGVVKKRARGIKPLNIFFFMHILTLTCSSNTYKKNSQVFQQKTKGWTCLAN